MGLGDFEAVLKPKSNISKMIWVALTFTHLLLIFMAYFLTSQIAEPKHIEPTIVYALAAVALVDGLISFFVIPNLFLSETKIKDALSTEVNIKTLATDSETGQLDTNILSKYEKLSSSERKLLKLSMIYFTVLVLRLALNEAVTLFGFVLAFLSGKFVMLLPFAAVGIMLNFSIFPNLERFMEETKNNYLAGM
jgi:hypothetical protein